MSNKAPPANVRVALAPANNCCKQLHARSVRLPIQDHVATNGKCKFRRSPAAMSALAGGKTLA